MGGPYQQYPEPTPGQHTGVAPAAYPAPPPGYAGQPTAGIYPGVLPPPVEYPKRRRWILPVTVLAVLLVVAIAVAALIAIANSTSSDDRPLSDARVKTAIQTYLDALADADTDIVARNALCGIYDSVKDRRSDEALAKITSDAFRKQFTEAEVLSVDKIVYASPNQASVLFTMRTVPAISTAREEERQAVAQVLAQDDQILVCSYLPRTGGQF